jgi:acetoin utilization deacetylase AcuC-like enzyme
VLQETLPALFARVQPELVLYNAGVDVHADDQLGLLGLSNEGIAARDRLVLGACLQAGVPLAAAIGGGYQKDHSHIVARHMHLHRAAAEAMPRFADMMAAKRQQRSTARSSSRAQA